MLTPLFDQLEARHSTRFARSWLGPLAVTRMIALLTLILGLIAVFANVKIRCDQGQIWKANSEITEIAGAMSFSTADAPYFLGHAAAAEKGLSPAEYNRKRGYPDMETSYQLQTEEKLLNHRPLLSSLISLLSPSDNPDDLLNAGHTILFVSAGLTVIMVMLAFGAIGYWLEGTVAAVGGGLSHAYLVRSSFGRIDTDQLNLGFMYLLFALIMFSARSTTTKATFFWAIIASLTANLFMSWYGKPELIWMAIAAYAWLLFVHRKDIIITTICLLLFYVAAPVKLRNPFGSSYVKDNIESGSFLFPNTHQTITEVISIPLPDLLVSATGSIEMGLVSLFGLGLWALRHPVMALAYGPLVAFAMLNFVVGNRAIFYSAPILWFGTAFLISTTFRFVLEAILPSLGQNDIPSRAQQTTQVIGVLIALTVAWVNSPTDYVPRPSFAKPVLQGLAKLRAIATPEASVVATWWDYGYASLFLNDLPTLHDGGRKQGSTTHLFAQALLTSNQSKAVNTLQFLTSKGTNGVHLYESRAELLDAVEQPANGPVPDIFLVLTDEMAGWIGSISKLANWNIETGEPLIPKNNNGNAYVSFINLRCDHRGFPTQVACGDVNVDFDNGLINGAPNIVGWSRARNGFAQGVRRYNEDATFGMQTLETNYRLSSQLMHRQLYDSSFNKLYHLGIIETPEISLVYDNYPHIRIYRITSKY